MWAFLFLAGLFSGWWGALSFAAPPAPSLTPSLMPSSSKSSQISPRDSRTPISMTYLSHLPIGRRNPEDREANPSTVFENRLEPYRYSSRHYLQGSPQSSRRRSARQAPTGRLDSAISKPKSYRAEDEDAEALNDASSIFIHDSLPRLRYGKDIVDEDASLFEQGSDVSGNTMDQRGESEVLPYALRSRPKDVADLYQEGNLELDNFMNYQVTPTSLRNADFDRRFRTEVSQYGDDEADEADRKRVVNNYRIMLENVRDYQRRHRIEAGPVYSDRYGPVIEEDIGERPDSTALAMYPSMEGPELAPNPRHTTQNSDIFEAVSSSESAMERPRVTRAAIGQINPKNRNRTRANSPREQRRQGRNKERRGQNWCPDADIGNRAYLAPTVFEGKARSMSSIRKPDSNYAVTFEVKQVYKSQPGFQPLVKNDSVRLHFRDKVPGKSTLCGGTEAGGDDSQSGIVRANIKRGKVYLVFVSRVGPRNFTILGEPMIRSKKNAQAVQAVIRPDYVREVTLSELRDAVARLREKVKLVCRTRGSPPPRVHWLKDGVPLHPRRGLRIQHKRRRSKVVIASARAEDSGQYECVAESTSGHRAALAAELLVTRAPETTTAAWPRQEAPCPISEDFCMNGGTCLFFETVGEPACRCAEGFTGLRCENKDVTSTGKFTVVVRVSQQLCTQLDCGPATPALKLLDKPSASPHHRNFQMELFDVCGKFRHLNPSDIIVDNFASKD